MILSTHTGTYTHKWTSLRPMFCEMSKILSYGNASCYNVANSASSFLFYKFLFFPFLCQHMLLLPTFVMPNGPFSTPAASKGFGFCFQSKQWLQAIALLDPRQHLLWWKCGQCSLTAASGMKPFPRVCFCGESGGRASALLLCSCPTGLPSRADRQYLQNAVEDSIIPRDSMG